MICEDVPVLDKEMLGQTILHELVHAHDYCTAFLDQSNCEQIACSEVNKTHQDNFFIQFFFLVDQSC